jgi:hypothetical protein
MMGVGCSKSCHRNFVPKIPRNRLGTIFVILRNKVLIPCDFKCLGRVYSITRYEREFSKIMKFGKTANKSRLFSSVLCPQKWVKVFSVSRIDSEWNSKVFSLPKMFRNRIRRFFLFQKWFGKAFRGLSYPKMVQTGILRVFIFQEMGWDRFPRFFSSAKQVEFLREPSPVPSCFIFHIVIVSMENGNPSCREK